MALGNWVIYNEQVHGAFIEEIQQNVDVFNAASANTIILRAEQLLGHYSQETFFPDIPGLIQYRDIDSDSAVTPVNVTTDEDVTVKLNRRIGPVDQTIDAYRKQQRDLATHSFVIGQMAARHQLRDMLNSALTGLVGATYAEGDLRFDKVSTSVSGSYVLGLQAGAAQLIVSEPPSMVSETITGNDNLKLRFQGETAYNVDLLGFAWNIAAGGHNPDSVGLGTGTNWLRKLTDPKSMSGVIGRFGTDTGEGLETKDFVSMLRLFGDAQTKIVAWVMNSTAYHDLMGEQIAGSYQMDTVAGVTINNGSVATFGRPVIVTDATALQW